MNTGNLHPDQRRFLARLIIDDADSTLCATLMRASVRALADTNHELAGLARQATAYNDSCTADDSSILDADLLAEALHTQQRQPRIPGRNDLRVLANAIDAVVSHTLRTGHPRSGPTGEPGTALNVSQETIQIAGFETWVQALAAEHTGDTDTSWRAAAALIADGMHLDTAIGAGRLIEQHAA